MRATLRFLRHAAISTIVLAGTLWLFVLAQARFGHAPRYWWLDLLDTFALYAFLPLLAIPVAAVVLRSRWLGLVAATGGIFFLVQFGWALMPRVAPTVAASPSLKILTYNLLSPNRDPEPLLDLIRVERPDVVVLQELTAAYVERLNPRVADRFPSFVVAGVDSANDGAGIYSRLPILEHEGFRLSEHGNVFQRVRLRTDAGDVWLVNVHLPSPYLDARRVRGGLPMVPLDFHEEERDAELARLMAEVRKLDGPFILAGDFNMAAGSRPSRLTPATWRDAHREAGEGFGHTFPSQTTGLRGRVRLPAPLIRIDYLFTSPELTPRFARVARIAGSDHLPVIAEILLPTTR